MQKIVFDSHFATIWKISLVDSVIKDSEVN